MASVPGYATPSNLSAIAATRPTWFSAPFLYQVTTAVYATTVGIVGSKTSTQPVDEPEANWTGHGAFNSGHGAIWYNRIQISPSLIALGNLITDKATTVEVWNGYLEPKAFDSLTSLNAEGIGIDAPITPPTTIGGLVAYNYTVTATTAGPATIDATFRWSIGGDDYDLDITGARIVVFPFLPNWSTPVNETLGWLTSIERAYDGGEQRTRWRDAARKELSFEVTTLDRQSSAQLENIMFGWQSRSFAVPMVTERSTLSAVGNVGATSITVDVTNRGFYAGMAAIIRDDSDTYEAIEIASISGSTLNLVRGLASSWPAGTPIYPAGVAQMAASQPLRRLSDRYMTGTFGWRFEVGDNNANTPVAAAALTYQDQEVFLTRSNWVEQPTFTYQDAYDTFGENTSGLLEFDRTSDWPTIIRRARYDFLSREEIIEFREFLARRAGRWAPVWIPSWNEDFVLLENANANATTLTVENTYYRNFVEGHPARSNLAIFLKDTATPVMVDIASTAANLDGSVNLVLNGQIGTNVDVSNVKRICHMNLFRLASDLVTVTWENADVATAILTWQLVKA